MCVRKAREKGRQNRSGSEGDEGERPWVTKKGEVGCRWRADERAYEQGGRGREAEKGSLIASECKRFGVRWDTGSQSGGRAG